jgi:VWFA-related protein
MERIPGARMPVPTRLSLLLTAALLLGAAAASAQQTPNSSVLHTRSGPPSRTINLDVVVRTRAGEPVTGLQQKDFTLLDNKTPRPITSFEAVDGSKQPVEAILLIDSVNTPYTEVAQERIQIGRFLHANGGKLALPTALAVLGDSGVAIQGSYSRDGNGMATGLDKYSISLRAIGRSAGVQGASERLDDSLKALRTLATYESQRPGRKIILWVSPGWPLLSGPGINLSQHDQQSIFTEITWLSAALREAQTTVYAVNPLGIGESLGNVYYYQQFLNGVKRSNDVSIGNLGLQVIASQTGGLVLNSTDVAGLLQECVADNASYYRISFEPPPTETRDVYHPLKVTVAKPDATAATSMGYYAEP